jgi:uncharacterized membrane protein
MRCRKRSRRARLAEGSAASVGGCVEGSAASGGGCAEDHDAAVAGRGRRGARLLGIVFVGAGLNHFAMPRPYRRIVPPGLGDPATLVTVSGIAEVVGGLGVLAPRTRRLAGLWLIALLAAVFPANLYMARNPDEFDRIPRWALYGRLPLQPLMMWWAWRATRVGGPRS